jgi:hypothetical protein
LAPSLNNSAVAWLEVGGEEMTIQRAIEVLNEFEINEIGRGVFSIKYTLSDARFDIISEQALIDLAREKEEME